jgi:hypothetical protein
MLKRVGLYGSISQFGAIVCCEFPILKPVAFDSVLELLLEILKRRSYFASK